MGTAGHRGVPHTADLRIEAWAPTREECVAQAVLGVVDAVAEVPPDDPPTDVTVRVGPAADGDLLVAVLDEVVYLMDTTGRVPATAAVQGEGGELRVRLGMVAPVWVVGAVPKAVSLHGLRFGRTGDGWACAVTLDV
jgi:SHS2 domain-containing protein